MKLYSLYPIMKNVEIYAECGKVLISHITELDKEKYKNAEVLSIGLGLFQDAASVSIKPNKKLSKEFCDKCGWCAADEKEMNETWKRLTDRIKK